MSYWKLVPVEPTMEMIRAGAETCFRSEDCQMDEEPYRARGQAAHAYMEMIAAALDTPIDMVLHCPNCGIQHIDASEPNDTELDRGLKNGWGNPPHRSHLCHGCGHIWRPADVATNGVAAVKTRGKVDSPIVQRRP